MNQHYFPRGQSTMYTHPRRNIIEIVSMTISDHSHSCQEHEACGPHMTPDVVMQLQKVQVVIDEKEYTNIAVY